jgi:cellulose biosynthesis protein BcsQ
MTTVALYSNKGGVGKTAAAVNLAYLAAQSGLATLICDLDPQGSTTFYFRVKPKLKVKARGLVKGRKQLDRSIKGTDYENLDLLPADFTHRNLDITFNQQKQRKQRLDMALDPLKKEYDLIILDCPPTINILAENIFNAADNLLVPLIPSTLSIRTHSQLLSFLKENKFRTGGVYTFFSFVDGRKKMHREMAAVARQSFDGVLQGTIPYLSHVEQMGIYREPVPAFAPASAASKAYQDLWQEIYKELFDEQEGCVAKNF